MLLLGLTMAMAEPTARVAQGTLEGTREDGLRVFRGVPFAAPPVGDLRWREPQPPAPWKGARAAVAFGPRPMQRPIFSDMMFRSPPVSEDCLYLNVWAPEKGRGLPVLVYFYGGGFQAGAADEARYDGATMARKGVVSITVNYRLGAFGFLAHPELSKESGHGSGDYGLLDQAAALAWVRRNAGAFGGDPRRITIGGESAGSFSVCAQMASPLSRGLIAGAIGESGAALEGTPLPQAEAQGARLGTLAVLRAIPAAELLERTKDVRFGVTVDGYFLPKAPREIYEAGEQAHVPLLAGWNVREGGPESVLGSEPATPEGLRRALRRLYPTRADEAAAAFPATTDAEALAQATALASDRFIGYGTWKWTELHARTGGKPVYRYLYARTRGNEGAVHSAEIEYALGNLSLNPHYAWTAEDRALSAAMLGYWADFVRTGDPNGPGLPQWPTLQSGAVMRLDATSAAAPDTTAARYRFLDSIRP